MFARIMSASVAVVFLAGSAALAQEADRAPPDNAKKMSEIVAKVEQRPDFRYISEIEWDDGAYEVTYYTTDKAKVEIRYDPLTANPK